MIESMMMNSKEKYSKNLKKIGSDFFSGSIGEIQAKEDLDKI